MADEFEAAVGLVTASVAANAIDHQSAGHGPHAAACANCAAPLSGPFCGQCGQRAHLHRSIGDVFHEFLHGITHFDGKAWTTLPMLMFQPGQLTRSYIEGQRARYIAPVPLFLLVVFLMFFVFSFMQVPDSVGSDAKIADGRIMTQAQAIKALPKAEAEIAKLDAQIKAAADSVEPGELAALNGMRIGAVYARDSIKARADGTEDRTLDSPGELARQTKEAAKNGKLTVDFGNETLNVKARKTLKNPELALYKLQSKAYKLSFLLVPLSLPWLWLIFFWRRGVAMYDHAIFTLYSISFMSLMFIVGSVALTANIGSEYLWVPLALAPGVHMFVQLRGAYGLGWWEAGWRTGFLQMAAVITISLYFVVLVVAGVLD